MYTRSINPISASVPIPEHGGMYRILSPENHGRAYAEAMRVAAIEIALPAPDGHDGHRLHIKTIDIMSEAGAMVEYHVVNITGDSNDMIPSPVFTMFPVSRSGMFNIYSTVFFLRTSIARQVWICKA